MRTLEPSSSPRRLESWKEIARQLNRTVRTVQRWEREQGLPVHRLQLNKLGTVFAYEHELDQWWQQRKVSLTTELTAGRERDVESPAVPAEALPSTPAVRNDGRRRWLFLAVVFGIVVTLFASLALRPRSNAAESDRLYSMGRQKWNQRTPATFREALLLFEQSIKKNPGNARAHAGLADTYVLMDSFGVVSKQESLPAARASAQRAVELGGDLGEPHASMSLVLWQEGDRAAAIRSIERAVAQEPSYATGHHWHSLYLMHAGRYAPAIDAGRRAIALDPSSPIMKSDLAVVLRAAGLHREAVKLLEEVVKDHPSFANAYFQLAELYRRTGRYQDAVDHLTAALRNGDTRASTVARLGWMQARIGDVKGALDAVARLRQMQAQGEQVPPPAFIEALVATSELDTAFKIVEDGLADKASFLIRVQSEPYFEALRRDPRWVSVQPRIAPVVAEAARRSIDRQTDRSKPDLN